MDSFNHEYDYTSTIFSPDGRLFQVEYARETIKKGSTTLGLKFKNGVLLATYYDIYSSLIDKRSINKIAQISDNIICAYVGLSADARYLIDYSQEIAVNHKTWYDEKITVKELVEEICGYKHLFTLYDGLRPFGLVLIIAGIDIKGVHLFGTDPSGAFLEYKAICEGENNNNVIKYFDNHYKDNMSKEKVINFSIDSIKKSIKKRINADNLEIGIIENNKKYYMLSKNEIKKIIVEMYDKK